MSHSQEFDALLVFSFGGPEGQEDVIPFLEGIVGTRVPRARLEAIAEHYRLLDGVSPINAQNRALIAALEADFAAHGLELPIYFGNRFWHPLLTDTLRQMAADGVRRARVFITSAYESEAGYQVYLDDIAAARAELGADAPELFPMPVFCENPEFIATVTERVRDALAQLPEGTEHIAFTAHSIPISMAERSPYVSQLQAVAEAVAEAVDAPDWALVYQSRSGPPHQPWLEPDIGDHLEALAERGVKNVVIAPIGFISDHMEVVYDLDTEAKAKAAELGMEMVRAQTVGTHPRFVTMIREMVEKILRDA